ncbi:SPS-sensor serine protease component Ssy5p [Trichomonascus vanleenenianus]|uniref:Ssy5p n=1 Tax=Trichomonascus vanleenenianus TaxID=2268995 RepID=UPI003ECB964A
MSRKFWKLPGPFSSEDKSKDSKEGEEDERAFGSYSDTPGPAGGSTSKSRAQSTIESITSSSNSSYQSSLFSRNAPSAGTMSTVESRPSKLAGGLAQTEEDRASSQRAGSMSSVNSSGKLMKVVDLQEISDVDDNLLSDLQSVRSGSLYSLPTSSVLGSAAAYSSSPMRSKGKSKMEGMASSSSSVRSSSPPASHRMVADQRSVPEVLRRLCEDLFSVMEEAHNSRGAPDLARLALAVQQLLKNASRLPCMGNVQKGEFSINSEPSIARIVKVSLHFIDNLLQTPQDHPAKMAILKHLYELGVKLRLVESTPGTVPYPCNFSVGELPELPSQELVVSILDKVANNSEESFGISEQDGAFIAPVLRGISPEFSALCLTFGFPNPEADHFRAIAAMYKVAPDVHVYCQKNQIKACNGALKAPYREPINSKAPPMAISLASQSATTLSGTLGGYVYPKVRKDNPLYEHFGKATYAMTCGHVVLYNNQNAANSEVLVPSPVLIKYYRDSLVKEQARYPERSEERRVYQREIAYLDSKYPQNGSSLNQPQQPFGQIAWGERKVVNGSLSDLAIIKCAGDLTCRNYLGDDIQFSEYDPALMFGNLYVKRIVRKIQPGMSVFKYGATSKYTKGKINGPRIVYWADGRIQTSEFVVAGADSSLFATGGDSGSWLYQKSEDYYSGTESEDQQGDAAVSALSTKLSKQSLHDIESPTSSAASTVRHGGVPSIASSSSGPCLGVVGMVHSYDGEKREFGLFTSIDSILERLYQVTNIRWGVVGVPDDEDEESPAGGSDSSSDSGHSDIM